MTTALITGVTGQDGIFLAKLLLEKGYSVYGMINGQRESLTNHITLVAPEVKLIRGDLADSASLISVLIESQPDEIYNLGAMSFVGMSFSQPELTANVTGLGVLRLLEAVRVVGLATKVKIYQASSSEMFGKVREIPQNELTPFHPRSPYAVAKTFAHHICINYREAYGMHISCGILFNHESELRGYEFVTRKITQGVARIKLGLSNELRLGNLDARRDWGYAGDYVEAMWLMLQQADPDDYVISTGETHSVREFLEHAFVAAGLQGQQDAFVVQDPRFMRPSEVDLLIGDSAKARERLGWQPKLTFNDLVKKMVENDIAVESSNQNSN
jgi:GDPmannose 4,6-dehydratase